MKINPEASYKLKIPGMINKKTADLAAYMKGFGRVYGQFIIDYNVPSDWIIELSPKPEWEAETITYGKEPELITLQEARKNKNPEDLIKYDDGHPIIIKNGCLFFVHDESYVPFIISHAHDRKWQIIPAEQKSEKVLSAKDYIKTHEWCEAGFDRGIAEGGRYEWENHKKLRNEINQKLEELEEYGFGRIIDAFKNLKPLKTE